MRIAGRISWASFIASHFPTFCILLISLITSVWPLQANFRGQWLLASVSFVVAISSLTWFAMSVASVVTKFSLQDRMLEYARLGRPSQLVNISDVVAVSVSHPEDSPYLFWRGANIELEDGSSFFLSFRYLKNAHELAEHLTGQLSGATASIEGCLNRKAVATALMGQLLLTCLLSSIAIGAFLLIGIALHRRVGNPWVFFVLGSAVLLMCATAFYCFVWGQWVGCVRWFRLSNGSFQYRTIFSPLVRQQLCADLECVTSYPEDVAVWKSLKFRDGDKVRLPLAVLQNAHKLYDAVDYEMAKRRVHRFPCALPIGSLEQSLSAELRTYLTDDEMLFWAGRPVQRKLWSEMVAEVLFGFIPLFFGVAAGAVGVAIAMRGELSGLVLLCVGFVFVIVGLWCMAAPWRYHRLLNDTVYAVTSRRALVLNGCTWGKQVAVTKAAAEVQSFFPGEVAKYQVIRNGRDIVLGGEWRRCHQGNHSWGHHGFLAPDDSTAAEIAILNLIASHSERRELRDLLQRSPQPFVK